MDEVMLTDVEKARAAQKRVLERARVGAAHVAHATTAWLSTINPNDPPTIKIPERPSMHPMADGGVFVEAIIWIPASYAKVHGGY